MNDTRVMVAKIVAMALVMVIGWVARKRNLLDASSTTLLSRFTADVLLAAMIFVQMLDTVSRQVLATSWIVPLLAAMVLVTGHIVAWVGWRVFCSLTTAPTFIFVVGIANWIYLPLPIVESLFGAEGVRQILLCNIGVQITLWTVGVATLHGGRVDAQSIRNLLTNPGLIATMIGIGLAVFSPGVQAGLPTWPATRPAIEALRMIGSLTIPLSLIVTGAQLGGLRLRGVMQVRPLAGVLLLRMILTPIVYAAMLWVAIHLGLSVPHTAVMVCLIIAIMPVAVSCSILAERFKQDVALAAQSILYTTIASIVTVPLLFSLIRKLFQRGPY